MNELSARMHPVPEGVSIIICCYNSAGKLSPTLQHIAGQQVPKGLSCELILVNNASTDDTTAVAATQWQLLGEPIPLQVLTEPKPGTDHARRAGVFAAKYNVILFCDDDNWLSPDYVATGWQYLQNHNNIGLLGGQSIAVADGQLPDWFHEMSPYYAACSPSPNSRYFNWEGMWSAGMFGRKSLLLKIFDPAVPFLNQGRVGNNTGCGEDAEICMRSYLLGFDTYYFDQLQFKHFISEHRLNILYAEALMEAVLKASKIKAVYQRALQIQIMSARTKRIFYAKQWVKSLWPISLFVKENESIMIKDFLFFLSRKDRYARPESSAVLKYVLQMRNKLAY